jgi:hypothetical protein
MYGILGSTQKILMHADLTVITTLEVNIIASEVGIWAHPNILMDSLGS